MRRDLNSVGIGGVEETVMDGSGELNDADIERVLGIVSAGLFDHVELELDGVKLVVSNDLVVSLPAEAAQARAARPASPPRRPSAVEGDGPSSGEEPAAASSAARTTSPAAGATGSMATAALNATEATGST